ncbi:MAG TPA: hypothetical protein VES67_12435 [Vicinamibacterales bacterium]|nr:hypothetical protein [Vicinamibacterales bacterium]
MTIGVTWGVVWFAAWIAIGTLIAILDSDSIDPGDTEGMIIVLAPMGLLTGIAFGILLSLADSGTSVINLSLPRAVLWGVLGCALVQVFYLGHGDQGLAANIGMALMSCVLWLLPLAPMAGGSAFPCDVGSPRQRPPARVLEQPPLAAIC